MKCARKRIEVAGHSLDICIHECVYEPAEDTMLIADALNRISRIENRLNTIVDLGSGTGILSLIALKILNPHKIISIDINPYAVHITRKNLEGIGNALVVRCNGLKCIRGKVDLIISNPPYLSTHDRPHDECSRWLYTSWGPDTLLHMLCSDLQKVSNRAAILYSTLSSVDVKECLEKRGYKTSIIASERFFMEELRVVYAWR